MAFSGFSKDTLRFLGALAKHNDKAWFDAHRADYEGAVLEPARAFVAALAPRLAKIDPALWAVPKINGSIMRLNRDMRFFAGRAPFKAFLDFWFWSTPERSWERSGFFLRVGPTHVSLGAGIRRFVAPVRDCYRVDVSGVKRGAPLVKVVSALRKKGYVVSGETNKKPPPSVELGHPRVQLLQHSGLVAEWAGKPPKEFTSAAFVGFVAKHFHAVAPLHAWLSGLR